MLFLLINSASGTALAASSFLLFSLNDLLGGFSVQLKVNGHFKHTFLYMLSAGFRIDEISLLEVI